MPSTLLIRLSKTGTYFKKNNYAVTVNGLPIGNINATNAKVEISAENGKSIVEIKDKSGIKIKKIDIKPGQSKIITINPSATREMVNGIFIGIGIVGFAITFMIYPKISFASFIPFVPIVFLLNQNWGANFELTENKFRT